MSNDVVIRVEGLWKQYRYGTISHASLRKDVQSWWARVRGKEDPNLPVDYKQSAKRKANGSNAMLSAPGATHEDEDRFWALQDINFEVKQGEVLGIIGRNGAGKSTLLKIMSKVTTPTKGQIKIKGRVASLLEVGTGFHPELTGRENIYLNGAILGMTKTEIKKKFDEIVAFAEIDKFIDTPVKRYSSGMYVRLAFAVAAHLEPEILIIDEVLAVGDASFQKKCLGKMGEVAKEGRTVLFVSHNMAAIQTLCFKVVEIRSGQIVDMGVPQIVVSNYLGSVEKVIDKNLFSSMKLSDNLTLSIFNFEPKELLSGHDISFKIQLEGTKRCRINSLVLLFYTTLDERIAIVDLRNNKFPIYCDITPVILSGKILRVPFVEGDYKVGFYIDSTEVSKDFFDLCRLSFMPKYNDNGVVPYNVRLRGLIELDFEVSSAI